MLALNQEEKTHTPSKAHQYHSADRSSVVPHDGTENTPLQTNYTSFTRRNSERKRTLASTATHTQYAAYQ